MLSVGIKPSQPEGPTEPATGAPVVEGSSVPSPREDRAAQLERALADAPLREVGADAVKEQPASGVDAIFARHRAAEVVAGGKLPRAVVEQRLYVLAAAGFSEQAQTDFIKYLREAARLPEGARCDEEGAASLSWVAQRLRDAVPSREQRLDQLTKFFKEQGLRLRWFDELPVGKESYQLDRRGLRKALVELEDDVAKGKRIGSSDICDLLAKVVDQRDLEWAQWQVERRLRRGPLANVDAKVKARVRGKLQKQREGGANKFEIGHAARDLRLALAKLAKEGAQAAALGEAPTPAQEHLLATWREQVARATADKDPDAIFYARRALRRELSKAKAAGVASENWLAVLDADLGTLSKNRLDRYTLRRRIDAMVASGQVDPAGAAMLQIAVSASTRPDELAHALGTIRFVLESKLLAAMHETWSEIVKNLTRSSDDVVDSNGNVVESAVERERRRFEKRRELARAVETRRQRASERHRADLAGERSAVLSAAAAARSTTEADGLRSRAGALEHWAGQVARGAPDA